jgi:hypothetical protein
MDACRLPSQAAQLGDLCIALSFVLCSFCCPARPFELAS